LLNLREQLELEFSRQESLSSGVPQIALEDALSELYRRRDPTEISNFPYESGTTIYAVVTVGGTKNSHSNMFKGEGWNLAEWIVHCLSGQTGKKKVAFLESVKRKYDVSKGPYDKEVLDFLYDKLSEYEIGNVTMLYPTGSEAAEKPDKGIGKPPQNPGYAPVTEVAYGGRIEVSTIKRYIREKGIPTIGFGPEMEVEIRPIIDAVRDSGFLKGVGLLEKCYPHSR